MEQPIVTDYEIMVHNIRTITSHQFKGTLILFVVEGRVTVSMEGERYDLEESDVLVINRNTLYSLSSESDNILVTVAVSNHFFKTQYEAYYHYIYECFSQTVDPGREDVLAQLRRLLARMVIAHSRNNEDSALQVHSDLYQIMLLLIRFFKEVVPQQEAVDQEDERITHILNYIEYHYAEELSLTDMAAREYLSPAYFSRYFKQAVGMNFSKYVTQVRLKHAKEDLIHSADTLFQVASRNGFSTTKQFTQTFKLAFRETPAAYRKKHQIAHTEEKIDSSLAAAPDEVRSPEVLLKVAKYVGRETKQALLGSQLASETLVISPQTHPGKIFPHEQHIVFVGELLDVLNAHTKKQLQLANEAMRVDYVGIRSLLSGATILPEIHTDEEFPSSSVYANSDLALRTVQSLGFKVFLRIHINELLQKEDAFDRLAAFFDHTIHVFGSRFVQSWRVLFYVPREAHVSPKRAEEVYRKLRTLLKKRLPHIQLGAFLPFDEAKGEAAPSHDWVWREAGDVDFISFDANRNAGIDYSDTSDRTFLQSQDYHAYKTKKLKGFLETKGIRKPLFLDMWNTLTGDTRSITGTFFRAALIFKSVLALSGEVQGLGFWINSKVHERIHGDTEIVPDSLELFHYYNGRRPVYYVMLFKERLRGTILSQGENHLLARNEDGYQLVIFHPEHFNPRYSVDEHFLRQHSKELHIKVENLERGEYQVTSFKLDRTHGALYDNLKHINSRHGIAPDILNYVISAAKPDVEIKDEIIADDWAFYAYMDINSIQFIELKKIDTYD